MAAAETLHARWLRLTYPDEKVQYFIADEDLKYAQYDEEGNALESSHFVFIRLVKYVMDKLKGAPYKPATLLEVEKILASKYNTSLTTQRFNRSICKKWENQIMRLVRGEIKWSGLKRAAQRRFHQQAGAWKDIREDVAKKAPALAKALNAVYNLTGKAIKAHD